MPFHTSCSSAQGLIYRGVLCDKYCVARLQAGLYRRYVCTLIFSARRACTSTLISKILCAPHHADKGVSQCACILTYATQHADTLICVARCVCTLIFFFLQRAYTLIFQRSTFANWYVLCSWHSGRTMCNASCLHSDMCSTKILFAPPHADNLLGVSQCACILTYATQHADTLICVAFILVTCKASRLHSGVCSSLHLYSV